MAHKSRHAAAIAFRCAADEINRFGLYKGALWADWASYDALREAPPAGPCCTGGALYKAGLATNLADLWETWTLFCRFIGTTALGSWSDAQEDNTVVQALLEAAQLIDDGDL